MKYIWLIPMALCVSGAVSAQDCSPSCSKAPSAMVELTSSNLRTHSYSTPITIRREAKSLPQAYAVSFNPNLKDQEEVLHTQRLVFQRENDAKEGTLTANPNLIRHLIVDSSDLHYFVYNGDVFLRGHTRAFYTRKP